jgi:glycosyltransferase involved in cell wall biosynthesis
MKICYYTDTFFPLVGGAEMVLHNLALQLSEWGESVHVLAPRVRGADNIDTFPYPVHRYEKPSSKRFLVRQMLLRLLWLHMRYHFDIVHCHSGYPPAYVCATFKKWFGVPFVVRPHGSDIVPGERIRKNARLERRLRKALLEADATIAQGAYLKALLIDLDVEEKKISTIHNGVNLARFSRAEPYSHPNPYMLAVGNLIPRKGFDILLRAYAMLEGTKPDLLLAGAGPEKNNLVALAKELDIDGRIGFLGHVDGQKKIDLYCSSLFFICPSRKEPFANVIIEAMAAGLPVVASAVDGNAELVHHEKHGLLFPAEDIQALSAALERLIGDAALVEQLGSAASDFVKRFDRAVIAGEYLNLYRSVAKKVMT